MSDNNLINKSESNRIWKMKAIAILCVICAHCSEVITPCSSFSLMLSRFEGNLGSLGVVLFFFLSGYLFTYKPIKEFVLKKLVPIVVPWIVCGSLVYLYIHIRKGGLSFSSWSMWIIGNQTYLWYMTVTLAVYIIAELCYYVSNRDSGIQRHIYIFSFLLSIGVTVINNHNILRFHPYLNIFRWFWAFSLGKLLREYSILRKMPSLMFGTTLFFVVIFTTAYLNVEINYWKDSWLLFSIFALLFVSMIPSNNDNDSFLIKIGKKSFSIYLLHMPFAGILTNLCNRLPNSGGLLVLFRPLTILLLTYATIVLIEYVTKLTRNERLIHLVIGSR